MNYSLTILTRAEREMKGLPAEVQDRVATAIRGLAGNPRPPGCLKMKERDGWRIRVGAYRVVFDINDRDRIVTVLHVGHRRDVYR